MGIALFRRWEMWCGRPGRTTRLWRGIAQSARPALGFSKSRNSGCRAGSHCRSSANGHSREESPPGARTRPVKRASKNKLSPVFERGSSSERLGGIVSTPILYDSQSSTEVNVFFVGAQGAVLSSTRYAVAASGRHIEIDPLGIGNVGLMNCLIGRDVINSAAHK